MNIKGTRSVDSIHKELGHIMWEYVGMARDKEGLELALQKLKEIRKTFDTDLFIPGTTDAAVEKHVPVWTVENGVVHVKVGSVEHPMLPEHYIEWVSLHTKQGNQRKELHPGEKPEVCFALCEEGLKHTGGYCPCRRERTEATKCMCQEFKDQIADPLFEGFCHCMLYYKSLQD